MTEKREGYCKCGCGRRTRRYTRNAPQRGKRKGEYADYLPGHANRKYDLREPYKVEDRGYETPCWIWQGGRDRRGYGRLTTPDRRSPQLAHRFFYEQRYGSIPAGLEPDHLCRVSACCRPEHLELVTHRENVRRGNAGRHMLVDRERAETVLGMIRDALASPTGRTGQLPPGTIAAVIERTGVSKAFVDKVVAHVKRGAPPPASLR
jgi:hypothetical protein